MIEINDRIQIPSPEYYIQFARSSGPGGQNVNKVNSKAILYWNIDDCQYINGAVLQRFRQKFGNRINQEGYVVIVGERFRDQPQNIRDCKQKLKEMLLSVLHPPKKRKPTKPSRASVEKRIAGKKGRSETKKNRRKVSF